MATSPEYLRLASSAARTLADVSLDALSDAIVVVDARHKHLPIVLTNASARARLSPTGESDGLIESTLHRWLTTASSAAIEAALDASVSADPSAGTPPESMDSVATSCALAWRFLDAEVFVTTEIKALPAAAGSRLVMLTLKHQAADLRSLPVVDDLPFNLLILDADFRVVYANAAALREAAEPLGLIGVSSLRLVPTAVLHPDVFARALQGHSHQVEALEVVSVKRWFSVDVHPLKGPAGIRGVVVVSRDVTAQRLGGTMAGDDDRRIMALTEHARDIISIASTDGTLKYVSGGMRNSLGYRADEQRSHHVLDHTHPDDTQGLRSKFALLVDGAIKSFSREFRVRHKDGSYHWLESSYTAAFDNPLIDGVVINSRDVTERKMAEGHLAQREEVFRLAAEAVAGIIFEWDIGSGFVHRSRAVQEVMGMEPAELEASIDAWRDRIHPHDFEEANKAVNVGLLTGRGWTTAYRVRDARGRYRSILDRGLVQRNAAGDPVRAIGCCVDVSEIKRVTDLLAETQRTARMGGWEYSYATQELNWTDEMYRIYETSPEKFALTREAMLGCFTPESWARFHDACERCSVTGGVIDLELEITTFRGRRIWVRMVSNLEILDGLPLRAYGSVQSIHARKLAQIDLETGADWLKLSMTMAHMHAWRWDRARDSVEFAMVDGQRGHLPSVFPSMKKILNRVHPAERLVVSRAIENAFQFHTEVQKEFRLKTGSGRYRWYAAIARPLFDPGNLPRGLVGVIQDITARRDAELRLRRSEELLRVTTANAADTLVLLDPALRVRFINKDVGGLTIQQIIGRDVGLLLPAAMREAMLDKLRHVLDTGEPAAFEFERLDGERVRYLENRAVLVRDEAVGSGISISMRDITERRRLEQEILDVSARERQSIGRDLHDGLGQELTGVALMLRGLAGRVRSSSPDAVGSVDEIVALVNQSIENARSLARGLLPVRSETGGLTHALRELAARSRDLHGLEVSFRAEVWPGLPMQETDASHLYRIAQEALTNAARHGHASRVDIFLLVTRKIFLLRISDDGEGFHPPTSPYMGMGLKIMQYRAGMIGATFEIAPNEPRGTVVRVMGEQPAQATDMESAQANQGAQ